MIRSFGQAICLATCLFLLVACSPKSPDKNIEVSVSWLTDRVPTQETSADFRKEAAEWFQPFRAAPCSTRFYFRVAMIRKEGPAAVKTELLSQKQTDIIDRIGGFQTKIGFKPGFKEIQAAAISDIDRLTIPKAILLPASPVHSPADIIESVRDNLSPALLIYKNSPGRTMPPASAPTSITPQPDAFRAAIQKALCPAVEPGNQDKQKPKPTNIETVSVLLVDLVEQPTIPISPVPASAPEIIASAPAPAPAPIIASSAPRPPVVAAAPKPAVNPPKTEKTPPRKTAQETAASERKSPEVQQRQEEDLRNVPAHEIRPLPKP